MSRINVRFAEHAVVTCSRGERYSANLVGRKWRADIFMTMPSEKTYRSEWTSLMFGSHPLAAL
jgi:hypothetical protein